MAHVSPPPKFPPQKNKERMKQHVLPNVTRNKVTQWAFIIYMNLSLPWNDLLSSVENSYTNEFGFNCHLLLRGLRTLKIVAKKGLDRKRKKRRKIV